MPYNNKKPVRKPAETFADGCVLIGNYSIVELNDTYMW